MTDMNQERQLADLNALLEVSRELGATTELIPLLRKVEWAVRQVLDCDRATVFLYDQNADELYSLVATGAEQIRFAAKLGIAGQAFKENRQITVHDAYADNRFNRAIDKATGFHTRNILTFPMQGHDGNTVGVLQALNKRHAAFDPVDEEKAADLGRLAGVAIQRQMLLDEFALKQRMERDLALARDIQQRLLPKSDPSVKGYAIAGWSKPADATGGDCYDYVPMDHDRLGIFLADATGHGIGPALIVSECRALIRALGTSVDDPATILQRANVLLNEDLDTGRFVTTFFGVLDPIRHLLPYLSAGQGPLLHFHRTTGAVDEIGATTYPLGILPTIEDMPSCRIEIQRGDVILLATDGFYEWADPDGAQFGTQRVVDVLRASCDCPPRQLIHELYRRVEQFGRGTEQADDVTAVAIKRE